MVKSFEELFNEQAERALKNINEKFRQTPLYAYIKAHPEEIPAINEEFNRISMENWKDHGTLY